MTIKFTKIKNPFYCNQQLIILSKKQSKHAPMRLRKIKIFSKSEIKIAISIFYLVSVTEILSVTYQIGVETKYVYLRLDLGSALKCWRHSMHFCLYFEIAWLVTNISNVKFGRKHPFRPEGTRTYWVITRFTRTCEVSCTARSRFQSRFYTGEFWMSWWFRIYE